MPPQGENTKQYRSFCGFNILLLQALYTKNAPKYVISRRKKNSKIFWEVLNLGGSAVSTINVAHLKSDNDV